MLAHTGEGATYSWERLGYRVIGAPTKVRKGETHGPPKPTNQFHIDRKALAQAIEFLGIKRQVKVSTTNHQGGRGGVCWVRPGDHHHTIRLKSWLSANDASEALWHELTHCQQNERLVDQGEASTLFDAITLQINSAKNVPYNEKPYEVEAFKNMVLHQELPLCKPTNFATAVDGYFAEIKKEIGV
jgi:hypothetical protein